MSIEQRGVKQPRKLIGKSELESLLERTGERDRALLQALEDYRFLLTSQIQRLYFRQAASKLAALRATNRCLLKLEGWGLLTTLRRRIGGVRAGSGSYVWTLTPVGHRLLELLSKPSQEKATRKRLYEPSPFFVQHTLAVAEVALRLTELAVSKKIGLIERQVEPDCWRDYVNAGGTVATLRPDLCCVTIADGGKAVYEDHWFIEVDLATESPVVVVRKCQQYLAYMKSGEEQKARGVFPLIVWVVPDEKRKASLEAHIAKELPQDKSLFILATLEQFEKLVLQGAPCG
ncbi:MAG: replication-relaxation family protein [Coriobacteriia bacterium]|nr:replication-relaxation family protein [Coriobacteriia bacterium]